VAENKPPVEMPLPEIALPAAERQSGDSEIAAVGVGGADSQLSDTQATEAQIADAKPLDSPAAQIDLKLPAEGKKVDNLKESEPKIAEPKVVNPAAGLTVQQTQAPISIVANPADKTVSMTFSDRTWVSVTDKSGKVIYEKMSHNGDTETINGKPPFNMVIGNAGATKLSFAGQNIDLAPHTKNNVARMPWSSH